MSKDIFQVNEFEEGFEILSAHIFPYPSSTRIFPYPRPLAFFIFYIFTLTVSTTIITLLKSDDVCAKLKSTQFQMMQRSNSPEVKR